MPFKKNLIKKDEIEFDDEYGVIPSMEIVIQKYHRIIEYK